MVAVDHDLDVQPVMHQQHGGRACRIAGEARNLSGIGKTCAAASRFNGQRTIPNGVAGRGGMAAISQRRSLIEQRAAARNHLRAAKLVVATGTGGPAIFGDGISSVEGIIKATPARIGSVQGVASIGDRYHELRSRNRGDLGVHICRLDLKIGWLGLHISDVTEESFIIGGIKPAAIGAMVIVDLLLQRITAEQQLPVCGSEAVHELIEPGPEPLCLNARAWDRFIVDEGEQHRGDR